MLDAEHRAAFVIGEQAEGFRVVCLREDIDDRQIVGAKIDGGTPIRAPRGDDQTVNLLPEQLVEVLTLARRVVGRVAHEDRDAVVGELSFERFENRQREASEAVVG